MTSNTVNNKRAFFKNMMCIYGRKAVLEALQSDLPVFRIHVANSNKPAAILTEIQCLAEKKGIDIMSHSKLDLSRISKNGKQDQGIAADIICDKHCSLNDYLSNMNKQKVQRFLALDGVNNPQNVGMIIRSACAGGIDGIILPAKGSASLSPLVIKSSAGVVFKAPILHCPTIDDANAQLKSHNILLIGLNAKANRSLVDFKAQQSHCYILGNESKGLSDNSQRACDIQLSLPMENGVESLNVAVSAALVSYAKHFNP